MLNIRQDIHSLTEFKRKTAVFMKQLKKGRRPVVLTVNGKAAIIVQTVPGFPVSDDVELLNMFDKQMDDGNIETGNVQVGSTNSLVYIIEK